LSYLVFIPNLVLILLIVILKKNSITSLIICLIWFLCRFNSYSFNCFFFLPWFLFWNWFSFFNLVIQYLIYLELRFINFFSVMIPVSWPGHGYEILTWVNMNFFLISSFNITFIKNQAFLFFFNKSRSTTNLLTILVPSLTSLPSTKYYYMASSLYIFNFYHNYQTTSFSNVVPHGVWMMMNIDQWLYNFQDKKMLM